MGDNGTPVEEAKRVKTGQSADGSRWVKLELRPCAFGLKRERASEHGVTRPLDSLALSHGTLEPMCATGELFVGPKSHAAIGTTRINRRTSRKYRHRGRARCL